MLLSIRTSSSLSLPSSSISGIAFILTSFILGGNLCVVPAAVPQHRGARIIGGTEAARSEFPYIVSLTRRGGHQCGGIVVSRRWLLSAGHCVCNGLGRIMQAAQLQAVLGQYSLSEWRNTGMMDEIKSSSSSPYRTDLDRIVVPTAYSCQLPRDDIAMLHTAVELRLSPTVQIARLPTSASAAGQDIESASASFSETFRNRAIVCGWGWTAEDVSTGERADRLQKAAVTVWPAERCERMYAANGESAVRFGRGQMCAGHEDGGADACWADSGGPLVGGADGRTVIGVVSTGIGCGRKGLPGIYTEVAVYLRWIEAVMRSENGEDGIVAVI